MSNPLEPLLMVNSLKKFFGGVKAVDGISIDVWPQEIVGIVGPNGAGKTALVNCITGFYTLSSGSIHFLGEEISHLPLHERGRRGIARTFQNIRLLGRMTVLENVMAADRAWVYRPLRSLLLRCDSDELRKRALDLLERFRLVDKADKLAGNLAYGDARRLELARALATSPKLLFLDEPSAGMNEQETQDLVSDIKANFDLMGSVVVIEHDIGFIRALSHRVIATDYGRKIAEGSAQEVFSNPLVVEAYLGAEAVNA